MSEKNEILEEIFGTENVYAPAMDYRNPEMFRTVLEHLQSHPVDLLVGSSMGGYFAHCISSITGIETLLFNPAVHSRSMEPQNVMCGNKTPLQSLVLGKRDAIINLDFTLDYFIEDNTSFPIEINIEDMGHRVPADIFRKHLINQK
jgi:hypothetical protein